MNTCSICNAQKGWYLDGIWSPLTLHAGMHQLLMLHSSAARLSLDMWLNRFASALQVQGRDPQGLPPGNVLESY